MKDIPPHGTNAIVDIKIYEYSRSPGIRIGRGYFYPEDKTNNDHFRIKALVTNKTSQRIEIAEYPVTFQGKALGIDLAKMHKEILPNEHFKKVYYYPFPKNAKPRKFFFKFKDVEGNVFEVMTFYDGELQGQRAY
ncbi:hypothetical protein LPTSP4_35650 [Leptospira ryugenii]|uniref:Uncharacterized protein n=1 Tax=Leptospira ryugenii TaxID=1917863 RepID=A0A2P2E578_9LEPT|nr:hypothetical protein [Leptospira ryugenii]GBF52027.1 hypothetical protein LPTSP4_35650 [Leptospira ryugenii]